MKTNRTMKTKIFSILLFISSLSFSQVFVNVDAIGNNDGSSWADAYVNLNTALTAVGNNSEIWIAKGVYKAGVNRSDSFVVANNSVTIYGGFNGTESILADRDITLIHSANETILSGDLLGDDDANVTYNNTTRDDNSLRIVQVNGNNAIIDGVTITDDYADATSGDNRFGGGLSIDVAVRFFTINNAIIKNNVAWLGAGLNLSSGINNSNITINSCVFDNNLSSIGSGFYVIPKVNKAMSFYLYNSLFKNNRTADNTTNRRAEGASAGFIRAYYAGSSISAVIVNNTYVKNKSFGTYTLSDFPVLGFSKSNGSVNVLYFSNNIFWGNIKNAGVTASAIGSTSSGPINAMQVNNSIDELGFASLAGAWTLTNTSSANPLFTDFANNNFSLQSSSPAKNTGNNADVLSGNVSDLLGNVRIYDTTVDRGCYEYAPGLIRTFTEITSTNGNISPSGTRLFNEGELVNVVATPNSGYTFVRFDITYTNGTTTSATNPLSIIMNDNISVEAIFNTTAAVNNEIKVDFTLYPNPVKGILNITMNNDLSKVIIYNLQGQKVKESTTEQVQVSNLSQGIYLIKIEDENGNTAIKKFIKK